jgi:hypothetical protein
MLKRIVAGAMVFVFLLFSVPVLAEDAANKTHDDTVSGGIIGGFIGFAVKVLSDDPEAKVEDDKLNLDFTSIKTDGKVYDKISDESEVIFSMDLISYRF